MYTKWSGLIVALAVAALDVGVMVGAVPENPECGPMPGAIYTTDAGGNLVNGNIYAEKEDVYLNGGPGVNSPDHAPKFPDGEYYFQVTDPPGHTLLSAPKPRKITVTGGMFELVALAPFADTPNEDGVYKVWVTAVGCYVGDTEEPGSSFGFLEKYSKTDNFKVLPDLWKKRLRVRKFNDCNANGVWDPGEQEIRRWQIQIAAPGGAAVVKNTPVKMAASGGDWTVREVLPSDECRSWVQTALFVDGEPQPVEEAVIVRFESTDENETHEVIFGNTALSSITAHKFYDYNVNGRLDNCEPPVPGIRFELTGRDIFGDPAEPPNVHRTLYTGPDGSATFCGLYPGVYTLSEVIPPATEACNWRATTPTRVEGIVVDCESRDSVHLFGNIVTGLADFSSRDYWHKDGLAKIRRCLDPDGEPREQLALLLLEFVFNVWEHLDGPTMIETAAGGWVSTSDLIAAAVTAANRLDPDAREAQKAMISLLDELNGSNALVYLVQDFSNCTPTEEY